MEVVYSTTHSVEVQSEILAGLALIIENVKQSKPKFILLPTALRVAMKYSPEFQVGRISQFSVFFSLLNNSPASPKLFVVGLEASLNSCSPHLPFP